MRSCAPRGARISDCDSELQDSGLHLETSCCQRPISGILSASSMVDQTKSWLHAKVMTCLASENTLSASATLVDIPHYRQDQMRESPSQTRWSTVLLCSFTGSFDGSFERSICDGTAPASVNGINSFQRHLLVIKASCLQK